MEKAYKEYNLYKQKTKEDIEIAYEDFAKRVENRK